MNVLMILIWLIVFLIVGGVLWWAIGKLVVAFNVVEPLRTVIMVVVVLLLVLGFLDVIGAFSGALFMEHR
jgi:hypothetical protein